MMAFCTTCGRSIPDGVKFCTYCGTPAPEPAPEPTPAPEPVPASEPTPVPEPTPAPEPAPESKPEPDPLDQLFSQQPRPQPVYTPPERPEYPPAPQADTRGQDAPPDDPRYRPIGAWVYFGLSVLYAIPFVGFVLMLVFSFALPNVHIKSFSRSYIIRFLFALGALLLLILMIALVFRQGSAFGDDILQFFDVLGEAIRDIPLH